MVEKIFMHADSVPCATEQGGGGDEPEIWRTPISSRRGADVEELTGLLLSVEKPAKDIESHGRHTTHFIMGLPAIAGVLKRKSCAELDQAPGAVRRFVIDNHARLERERRGTYAAPNIKRILELIRYT